MTLTPERIYRERMSRVNVSTYLSYAIGWTMRIWRKEALDAQNYFEPARTQIAGDISATISKFVQHPVTMLELARAILELEEVNSVEIVDVAGFGETLHKDWP